MEPLIIVVGVIIVLILLLMNKSKKDDIEQLQNRYNNERAKFQNEINELKKTFKEGEYVRYMPIGIKEK